MDNPIKYFFEKITEQPDILCIQEAISSPFNSMNIPGIENVTIDTIDKYLKTINDDNYTSSPLHNKSAQDGLATFYSKP